MPSAKIIKVYFVLSQALSILKSSKGCENNFVAYRLAFVEL